MPLPPFPRVADLMATAPPTARPTDAAFDVARRMAGEELRHVLVQKGDALDGLVDRAALLGYLVAHYHGDHPARPIADFLVRGLVTTTPEAPVADALRLMARHRIGALPVLEGTRLVGLLSERALLPFVETLLNGVPAPHPAPLPLWETST